jgi:hypothetical protein
VLVWYCHVSFWKYDHTAAVTAEAMHNAHNYEFLMFPLATIIGLQVNHTIQPKLLMFNITTTRTPKANASPSIWTKQQCIAIGIKRNFVFRYFCLKCLFVEDRSERRKWRFRASNFKNFPDPPSYARSFQMLRAGLTFRGARGILSARGPLTPPPNLPTVF